MTAVAQRRGQVGTRLQAASRTTPGRYRLWSLAAAVLLVLATITATAAATRMRSSTRRAQTSSGPVLVATQQLLSSLAEADAAATAAFLSGRDEDPEQRRLYEQALGRADQQAEDIAALAGKDPKVRAAVGRVSVQLTQYAGLVEAGRASNRNGTPDANGYLVSAVQLAEQLVQGDVKTLTDDAQSTLGHDQDDRSRGFGIAAAVLVLALALLAWAQLRMMRASHRLVNLPLALATILTAIALGWLAVANQSSGNDMSSARSDGYDSIVITAQLGRAGFGAKAAETLALITGDTGQRTAADADAQQVASGRITDAGAGLPTGLLQQASDAADSARERAAVAEAAVRWQRYQATVASLRAAPNPTAAKAIAVGQASSDFNGFNFSLQSVLGQNRTQFLAGLTSAANLVTRLPTAVLLLLLAALAAMFWGFQLRINDYR